MEVVSYQMVRNQIKPADVIAYGGIGTVSNIIKFATRHPCSHVETVMQTMYNSKGDTVNLAIGSTSLDNGFSGVKINRLSQNIENYNGNVWWLSLSDYSRTLLNMDAFLTFLFKQEGKKYDVSQAIGSALDIFWTNKEDFSRLFCSELVAGAFEAGGILTHVNASELTPANIVQMALYECCYQLKGEPTYLPDFNKGLEVY